MSSNVVWNIIRKNSAFRVRRNGVEFSSEPGNLTNLNTFKFSGLAKAKTVDINQDDAGKTTLTMSVPRRANQPTKSKWVVRASRNCRKGGLLRRNKNVVKNVSGTYFRRDLEKAALARLTRIHYTRTRNYGVEKTPRARRAAKAE